MLTVEHIKFGYHRERTILRDVSFSLEDGQFLAILGNNGAGKSTLLKCFNQILTAAEGRVLLNGEDLLTMSHREIARHVAFVAQQVPETEMTVHDVVMLGRRPYMGWSFTEEDHMIVHSAMDRLGLSNMRGRFLSQLSGGERQKVVLARALAQQPKLLLLDEPTSSLDLQNQYQVLQTVRDICHASGIMAIVVIHDLNLAMRFCDRLVILKDGMVYRSGGRDILDREAIKEVYGVDAEVVEVRGQRMVLVDQEGSF